MPKIIELASEFGRFPGGRYRTDGDLSGEQFRQDVLLPALQRDDELVTIALDDVAGLPASFLEEAFGGLVRQGYSPAELRRRIQIIARTPRLQRYPSMVWDFINAAAKAANKLAL
jgi:hypothetical protein